ncbi:peptidylprolyl isomerase [Gaetbulibacter sp. M240]|uniref:peptidylprolyl isomerase n=1 Tax=Gaetbulibacter sp. M240 TaxID=3126511 RepID=UPI00374F1F34
MQLKTNNLKFIIKLKYLTLFGLMVAGVQLGLAQEIIEENPTTVADSMATEVTKVKDSTEVFKPEKVDGVAAVVGDYIVLDSDVQRTFRQLEAQGVNTKDITRCQLFGKLLEDKLYAHQAVQDSIIVSDAEIRSKINYQIEQFLQQVDGSMERLLKLYGKSDEQSLRDEMFEINKSNELSAKEQEKIIQDLEITPEEVRIFFNKIPEDERPTFGTELKVAQIVTIPKVSEEEKQRVINRLKTFREDIIENGSSFRSKAVLYSEDPGSASRGGRYTLDKKIPRMAKEFRQVAFSLQEGEVSDPFETEFGHHILTVDKIRGQEYDVSHILLIPKVSQEATDEAKERLEKIRKRIVDRDISFADAAKEASDEKETRADGGQLINPQTQDYNFELTRMDTELYSQIQGLKDGEVSLIQKEEDRTGKVKFKILMVTDRIDEHKADFARDYLKIKDLALEEKKLKAIEEWQKEKIQDTYIKINGEYRDCQFSSNWLKK